MLIILAIIILVISFVAAFLSLVREQTKFKRKISFDSQEEKLAPAAEKEKIVNLALNGKSQEAQIIQTTSDLSRSNSTMVEEPFPWEAQQVPLEANSRLDVGAGDQPADQLAGRLVGKVVDEIADHPVDKPAGDVADPKTTSWPVQSDERRLTGEIIIGRKSDE